MYYANIWFTRVVCRWDDPLGPVLLTVVLTLVLVVQFGFKVRAIGPSRINLRPSVP